MAAKKDKSPEKSPEELLKFLEGLKRRWMETVDAIIDPLMIVTDDYVIRKANKSMATIASSNVKEILGQKCYKVFADRDDPCPGCAMLQAESAAISPSGTRHKIYNLEGIRSERFYEATSQPVYDDNGVKEGTLQIYRDRTEAKRLQSQLMQSEKLASIGLLAGGVAHEINNPLGGILIFSQMLLREMDKESPHYQDVVEIEAATNRCKAIVDNLLQFSRQQPTGSQKKKERVSLKDAAKSALRFGQVGGLHNNIDVDEDFASEDLIALGNHNHMVQLFLNLIQNAFQAMPDGGTVTLRSYVRQDKDKSSWSILEIEDTGVGISAENLKRIFDPFFTSKGPGEGTGLGLSICYGIAEDLGGTIEVESVINEGSRFRLVTPYTAPVETKATA